MTDETVDQLADPLDCVLNTLWRPHAQLADIELALESLGIDPQMSADYLREMLRFADNAANEVADWLAGLGYPFDWSCDILPPAWLRGAIEEAWVRHDGPDDADMIRVAVADEGHWLDVG